MMNASELIEKHQRLLRSLFFHDDDYENCVFQVISQIVLEDSSRYYGIKGFINERFGNVFKDYSENISTHGSKKIGKVITFSPNPEVFMIPDKQQDENLVSVMMPFNDTFKNTYETIKSVCSSIGVNCQRADDIWNNQVITQDIFDLIFTSKVVIADFTAKNPNVFYEVGIAHTLGKVVIPIAQSIEDVPSDLRHHRVLIYLPNGEGYKKLHDSLKNKIADLFK